MGLSTDIKDFFFPRLCPVCGKRLTSVELGVCTGCQSDLAYTGIGFTPGNELERKLRGRFTVERATALFYYKRDGHVAEIIRTMKYRSARRLCSDMGKILASRLSESGFFKGIDCLVPIPLHAERLRHRGYNQSELICLGLSARTGIPTIASAVIRRHNNATQTKKEIADRDDDSMEELFNLTPDGRTALRDKHVAIVDDVITTGATVAACCKTLSSVPGIRISVLSLGWTK